MINFIKSLITRLYSFPENYSSYERNYYVVYNSLYTFALLGHLLFVPIFWSLGNQLVFVNNVACVFLDILCIYLNLHGHGKQSLYIWITEITYHATVCTIIYGWQPGFFFYYITLTFAIFITRRKLIIKIITATVLFSIQFFLYDYSTNYLPVNILNDQTEKILYFSNAVSNFLGTGYLAYFFIKVIDESENELKYQATHDKLTGVFNRGAILEILRYEINRANRTKQPLSLIMADIDFFKKMNDHFGHIAGDRVLQHTTKQLESQLRNYDYIGRYGGEEFIILLPNCDINGSTKIAERLRYCIENSLLIYEEMHLQLTMSFGIATVTPGTQLDSELLIHYADKALYMAKNNGRNRVTHFAENDKAS